MTLEGPDPELTYHQNAWIALRMIRDAIEELGPVVALPSSEAVVMLYGPEPVHEAEALIEGIRKIAGLDVRTSAHCRPPTSVPRLDF